MLPRTIPTVWLLLIAVPLGALIGACNATDSDEPGNVEVKTASDYTMTTVADDEPELFPHEVHVQMLGSCDSCHTLDADGALYAMPELDLCLQCHAPVEPMEVPAEEPAESQPEEMTPEEMPAETPAEEMTPEEMPADTPEDDMTPDSEKRLQEPSEEEEEAPADVAGMLMARLMQLPPEERFPVRGALTNPDVRFTHTAHDAAGVDCASCHSRILSGLSPQVMPKPTCLSCHAEAGGPVLTADDCSRCHLETNAESMPASHQTTVWESQHGDAAPDTWRSGDAGQCGWCHQAPDDCTECHRSTPPASHRVAAFGETHGQGVRISLRFSDMECASCHVNTDCTQCHMTTPPNDHSAYFRAQGHGLEASMDRERCSICHRQDTCVRCHLTQEPRSHVASWGGQQQQHCVSCHLPASDSSCQTCHFGPAAHLTAPARPYDSRHRFASDCRTCHSPISHPDNGDDCRLCHAIVAPN